MYKIGSENNNKNIVFKKAISYCFFLIFTIKSIKKPPNKVININAKSIATPKPTSVGCSFFLFVSNANCAKKYNPARGIEIIKNLIQKDFKSFIYRILSHCNQR